MQQIMPIWQGLSIARRIIVIAATGAIFLAILGMSRIASQPSMSLLYSGLDAAAAGEVVQALQQRGMPHEVRGTSIYVSAAERDQLRLMLASEGMPASGGQGYELLDVLTGFGTTSQMFDATYVRAKEGELARTIVASPDISSARVHIATGSENPFRRDLTPTASVHLTGRSGPVDTVQAQAIRHLVAAAVTGLAAQDVAIIDGKLGLIDPKGAILGQAGDEVRAQRLRERVQRLVEARVGRGNAVVEVSVDSITEAETIMEQSFDPDSRFIISSDSEERSDQSENSGSGAVSVASNLPDGDANTSETQSSQSNETRERLNYEVSQTTREVLKSPGGIKRLTVAVLVNGTMQADAAGVTSFVPMPEEELSALRDLVASAVGFDEARGDEITLRSMPFEPTETLGSLPSSSSWLSDLSDPMSLIQLAVLSAVALLLGLFVVRPILMSKRKTDAIESPRTQIALPATEIGEQQVLTGTIEPADSDLPMPALAARNAEGDPSSQEDPVARLRALIEDRRSETVEILRSWLDESPSEKAR